MLLSAASMPSFAAPQLELREVGEGVFVHAPPVALVAKANAGDICNLGIVIGEEAAAVVDSGGSLDVGRRFHEAVARITAKPVRYVINTHMHPDHVLGNGAFAGAGATVVGHRNLPRALAARREHYLASYARQIGADLVKDTALVAPTLLVEREMDLDLGGRRLRLRAWPPAHTDNDLTVFDERSRTLFTGDLVFLNHTPVLDGSLKGWLGVMDGLRSIPARLAVPGHGAAPHPWPEALAPQQRYLARLAEDTRRLIAEGATIADAAGKAAASERPHWQLFDDYNPRNATAAFGELEWE